MIYKRITGDRFDANSPKLIPDISYYQVTTNVMQGFLYIKDGHITPIWFQPRFYIFYSTKCFLETTIYVNYTPMKYLSLVGITFNMLYIKCKKIIRKKFQTYFFNVFYFQCHFMGFFVP